MRLPRPLSQARSRGLDVKAPSHTQLVTSPLDASQPSVHREPTKESAVFLLLSSSLYTDLRHHHHPLSSLFSGRESLHPGCPPLDAPRCLLVFCRTGRERCKEGKGTGFGWDRCAGAV